MPGHGQGRRRTGFVVVVVVVVVVVGLAAAAMAFFADVRVKRRRDSVAFRGFGARVFISVNVLFNGSNQVVRIARVVEGVDLFERTCAVGAGAGCFAADQSVNCSLLRFLVVAVDFWALRGALLKLSNNGAADFLAGVLEIVEVLFNRLRDRVVRAVIVVRLQDPVVHRACLAGFASGFGSAAVLGNERVVRILHDLHFGAINLPGFVLDGCAAARLQGGVFVMIVMIVLVFFSRRKSSTQQYRGL